MQFNLGRCTPGRSAWGREIPAGGGSGCVMIPLMCQSWPSRHSFPRLTVRVGIPARRQRCRRLFTDGIVNCAVAERTLIAKTRQCSAPIKNQWPQNNSARHLTPITKTALQTERGRVGVDEVDELGADQRWAGGQVDVVADQHRLTDGESRPDPGRRHWSRSRCPPPAAQAVRSGSSAVMTGEPSFSPSPQQNSVNSGTTSSEEGDASALSMCSGREELR
jgi:hypothetical protein